MYNIIAETADWAWLDAALQLDQSAKDQESRTYKSASKLTKTKEILHAGITIKDPRQRVVFSRPINPAFAIAEVIWIMAGGNKLDFLEFWNPRMKTWSDNGETMYGAYGYRLSSMLDHLSPLVSLDHKAAASTFDQLYMAYQTLVNKPHSRQVILQIWDAEHDFPNSDGSPRSKDIPCNIIADLKVRDGKLHWMQIMRSNDLIWGTPYNFIQWMTIQEIVAGWLGLDTGDYTHVVSSLHVYEQHYAELEQAVAKWHVYEQPVKNEADLRIEGYKNWQMIFNKVVESAIALTKADTIEHVYEIVRNFNEQTLANHDVDIIAINAYAQWVYLLAAEAARRKKLQTVADCLIDFESGMGAYYAASWRQWVEFVENK